MDSKTPIEWLQELSTCHCTRWYEHDREQAESLIAEIILFTAERDRYKAERDGLVTLCEKILKIMERDNDQFRSDTRG
jgi:hypothetical protein